MRNKDEKYNFTAFGLAITKSRMKKGMTRELVQNIIYIENKVQHPSLQIFYDLVTLLNISVDEYFYSDSALVKSTIRIETQINSFNDKELMLIKIIRLF